MFVIYFKKFLHMNISTADEMILFKERVIDKGGYKDLFTWVPIQTAKLIPPLDELIEHYGVKSQHLTFARSIYLSMNNFTFSIEAYFIFIAKHGYISKHARTHWVFDPHQYMT